ncbi:MAG: hypothetical protein JWQ71_994 [Pedosphaera sp.]|nr:hypothetical protein [Pedosphaera sp.]
MARRTGKIARLSPDERDEINFKLEQGMTYKDICTWLKEEEGYDDFNEGHISSWYKGGYQDWVEQNLRVQEIKEQVDLARELGGGLDGDAFQEANLQLAAGQFFEVLAKLDVSSLQEKFVEKPEAYVRLINSLCRLTKSRREFLAYQQEKKASDQPSAMDVMLAELRLDQAEEMDEVRRRLRDEARAMRIAQRRSRDESPELRASESEGGERKTEGGKGIEGEDEGTKTGVASKSELLRANASSCELVEGQARRAGDSTPYPPESDRPACGTELQTNAATEGGALSDHMNVELQTGELMRPNTSSCELNKESRAESGGSRAGQPEGMKAEDGGLRMEDSGGEKRRTGIGGRKTEVIRASCRTTGVNGKGDRGSRGTEVGEQKTEAGGAKGKGDRINAELQTKRAADSSGSQGQAPDHIDGELQTNAATEGGAP